MTTSPKQPENTPRPEREDAPEGDLPGLQEHNRHVLGERSSKVVDSILPQSPTDDELRGKH